MGVRKNPAENQQSGQVPRFGPEIKNGSSAKDDRRGSDLPNILPPHRGNWWCSAGPLLSGGLKCGGKFPEETDRPVATIIIISSP